MSAISVTVAGSPAALAADANAWQELVAAAEEPNPYYEPWMFLPSLAADAAGLRCLLVWRTERGQRVLDGFLPFRVVPRFKGMPLAVLSSWTHPSWPLGTPLLRRGRGVHSLQAVLAWLDDSPFAGIELRAIPCDGPVHTALATCTRESARMLFSDAFTRPLLRRAASAEEYLEQALSRESRKDLRRKARRLGEAGRLEPVALAPGADPAPWIEAFLNLEGAGWKGAAHGALACKPGTLAFARAALAAAHRLGRLELVGLDLDGKPISRCINLTAGPGGYAYRTAYDERFARHSPGILAEIETIRALHADPRRQWMDSITDPDNATLGRLWTDRRSLQSTVVASGAIGELWVSMLPLLRWTRRRIAPRRGRKAYCTEPSRV